MTRIDHIEWAAARVERVEMTTAVGTADGKPLPTMTVEMHYVWKARRFSKRIESVLN